MAEESRIQSVSVGVGQRQSASVSIHPEIVKMVDVSQKQSASVGVKGESHIMSKFLAWSWLAPVSLGQYPPELIGVGRQSPESVGRRRLKISVIWGRYERMYCRRGLDTMEFCCRKREQDY